MNPYDHIKEIISKTRILKSPKHRLSTFGQTNIPYFFLSDIEGFSDRARLRQGVVLAQKPMIITADAYRRRFEGFGKEAEEFGEWLYNQYGNSFKALEYHFKNEDQSSHIEHSPKKILAEQIEKRITEDESSRSAIIEGPDSGWEIALTKFIIDECHKSFSSNVRELDEHGFFDSPEKTLSDRRKRIDELFEKCKQDRALIPQLGRKLQENQLFREYEDRFYSLIQS